MMKQVSVVTQGLWANPKAGEFIGADERQAPVDEGRRQMAQAINDLFKELRLIRSAWRQAWPDKETYQAAKVQWMQAFLDEGICSQGQIEFGMIRARKQVSDFIPSPGQFIEWCKPTPEMLGLPPLATAHREACRNAHPGMAGQGNWSHDAVWHAAKECGFENLNQLDLALSLKLFERNYTIAIRRLIDGLPLQKMPQALPSRASGRITPEVGRKALEQLRSSRLGGHPNV
ncbi:replication protein P [Pseudomonas sp. 910_21]|uniref:replication protein P n=1 Tax=Pseudomonas sp. 910_21 TaxID=2604460 RepID=UPI00406291CC